MALRTVQCDGCKIMVTFDGDPVVPDLPGEWVLVDATDKWWSLCPACWSRCRAALANQPEID